MIDGDRWIAERLAFLRGLLDTGISDEQRTAVETEIRSLSKERGIQTAGRRRLFSPIRWLGRRGRPTP
jgi:hypothetical protein